MRTLHCRDAGFDCDGVIKGSSDEEVLGQAEQHTHDVHGMEATPQMTEQLKRLIREE
jgi:predicted small metal-binding protein